MNLIRVYFIPKGYVDVICDHVKVYFNKVEIIGGEQDDNTYVGTRGARLLKEDVVIQGTLF